MVAEVLPPHSVISQAIHYAENNPNEQPILFLDEINRTTSDVTSGTLTLVTLRRIGDKALPKNLRIIVAGNDKGNVTALDDASVSRFAIINVEPDAHTLIDVLGDNLHPWVKMVLEKHPETIFVKNVDDQQAIEGSDDDDENATVSVFDLFDGSEEIRPFATPRTIDGVSRYLTALSTEKLMSFMATAATTRDGRHVSYLQETIEGLTGNTSFTTLLMGVISEELSKGTNQTNAQRVVKPGKVISRKYIPDIHIYLDTSGSISTENYEDTIKMLITFAKKMGVDLYFTSFSHIMSTPVRLRIKDRSVAQVWKQFAAVPKVSGGTDYQQIYTFINEHPVLKLSSMVTGQKPIILNMAEYHDSASINRIIGSPTGYVGSDSAKERPFDTLASNPYRVIVLDEFEKADMSVQRLFLSALDTGEIQMANGPTIDLSRCIVIATTNAGRQKLSGSQMGFGDHKHSVSKQSLTKELQKSFDAELLGRFDDLIAFMPLDADDYAQILRDKYDRQVARIRTERPDLSFDPIDDDTIARLVDETWLVDQGARPAIRAIRALIEDMLLAQAANS